MTAKPICIVYVPESTSVSGNRLTWEDCWGIAKDFSKNYPDYHWFCFPNFNYDTINIEFKVFYEKDFTEIQYQELKKIIEESIKNK